MRILVVHNLLWEGLCVEELHVCSTVAMLRVSYAVFADQADLNTLPNNYTVLALIIRTFEM